MDFLAWLSATVRDALRASEQHEALKRAVRELRASVEDKFALAAIQVRRGCWSRRQTAVTAVGRAYILKAADARWSLVREDGLLVFKQLLPDCCSRQEGGGVCCGGMPPSIDALYWVLRCKVHG